jgi:hypothetical protein
MGTNSIKEIFDMVIDFPDSIGALHDLRVSNPTVRNVSTLTTEFRIVCSA